LIAFLFGGIVALIGASLVMIGLILLFFLFFPVADLVVVGIGLIMVIIATQAHMGIIQCIAGGLF